jgi:hypothetical protein
MKEFSIVALIIATKLAFGAMWVAGWVLAHGFWSTLFAVFLPPWGWYLVAERLMQARGWI